MNSQPKIAYNNPKHLLCFDYLNEESNDDLEIDKQTKEFFLQRNVFCEGKINKNNFELSKTRPYHTFERLFIHNL